MRIGLYPQGSGPGDVALVAEAERLGYDSLWAAESYGLDAITAMAWWAAKTTSIRLGTIVSVIDGRSPATAAMSAISIDELSGGRFVLGLGVSGPVVVEGWYGKPFRRPLARTREYVEIIRKIQAREEPASFEGEFYQLPYHGPGATGLGKPLKSIHRPRRTYQPIYLASEGPKAIALAAELADGWTAFYLAPQADTYYRARLAEGFASRSAGPPEPFEVVAQVHVAVDDDVEVAADHVRGNIARFVGGMGHAEANFHFDALARIGFEAECRAIQRLWSQGDRRGAAASVPLAMVEALALVGPWEKIRAELPAWKSSCITLLVPMVSGRPLDLETVRRLAELVGVD